MRKIDRFCEAIMKYEGWTPGSRSYRNCNPGNLRSSKFACANEGGYAVFESFADGWNALVWDVSCKATGKTSTSLTPTSTIREFFHIYAPSADDNHPEEYCRYVCGRAKVEPDDELWTLMERADSPCDIAHLHRREVLRDQMEIPRKEGGTGR